jgi:hypothetical protein
MAKCSNPKCGVELKPSDKFCTHCGKMTEEGRKAGRRAEAERRAAKVKLGVIIGAICVFTGGGFIGGIIVGGRSPVTAAPPPQSAPVVTSPAAEPAPQSPPQSAPVVTPPQPAPTSQPVPAVTTPQVPRNVRAGTPETDRVTLSWDSAGSGVSYRVYNNTQNNTANAKTTIATGTSATVTGLTSNTNYYFWVTSIKGNEESVKSSVLTVKTSTTISAPPANPLNGTTWEYINQNDSGNRYRLTFSGSNGVTWAVYNSNGSREEGTYNGTYWLQGSNLTVKIVNPNGEMEADNYTYTQSAITNKIRHSVIYKKQ